jgi:hypothetical protein
MSAALGSKRTKILIAPPVVDVRYFAHDKTLGYPIAERQAVIRLGTLTLLKVPTTI